MKNTYSRLCLIILGGFILRLLLLLMIQNPGLNDQNHYYNLGRRLLEGQGFTIDYVWHYSHVPDDIVHPIDHWMPLSGVATAIGMAIGGENPRAALMIFLLAGTALPALVFVASKQLEMSDKSALIASAFASVLSDIVWNSLRSDSTILNMLFISAAILLLNRGLSSQGWWTFILSGICAGLAYLTRNDSILFLPMLILTLGLYGVWRRKSTAYQTLILAFVLSSLAFVLTITPWLMRNQRELGMLGTAETSRMFFMVDQRDHYAYDTVITLETMLKQQSIEALISKRLFEFFAAIKQMLLSLDILMAGLVILGLWWLIRKRDKERLFLIAPTLIWLIAILIAYPLFLPYKSQSGSFEKAFLTIVPLLIPIGVLGLEQLKERWQVPLAAIFILTMSLHSYMLVRQETDFANVYYASIQKLVDTLETLPDTNGDGEIRLMSQDPYVMSTFGYKSVMTPFSSREQTIELARRYQIDYLLMPPGRPALDKLYLGQEVDERFVLVAHIADAGVRPFELYRFASN